MDMQPKPLDDPDEVEEVEPEDSGEVEEIVRDSLKLNLSSLTGLEIDKTLYPHRPHLSEPDEDRVEPVLESYDKKEAQLVDGCLVCKKCRTKNPLMVNKCSGCGAQFRR